MIPTAQFSFPTAVRFGCGRIAELPGLLEELCIRRPMLVTDPGLRATALFTRVQSLAGNGCVAFSNLQPNPVEADVEALLKVWTGAGCDGVIGFGGGSALDVAKIVRARVKRPEQPLSAFDFRQGWNGLAPFIAIPTTAGTGSEVGRSAVITLERRKRVFFHPSLLAAAVILDPELTAGLPAPLTAATGADALTHCIESFTSPIFHPLCDGIALEGARLVREFLPRATAHGDDLEARGMMQVAAMMGGIAFQKDLGAAHSLAHPLSALHQIHHGLANALCLPAVMKFNASRKPGLYRRLGEAFGLAAPDDAAVIAAVEALFQACQLAGGLAARGIRPEHLEALSEEAFLDPCHTTNPVPVTREDLFNLYRQAL